MCLSLRRPACDSVAVDAKNPTGRDEWTTPAHAAGFIARRPRLGRAADGDAVLDEIIPETVRQVLDLGTGGGHLIALLATRRPETTFVGIDASPTMLAAARARFDGTARVRILAHDLALTLPVVGRFDAIVSAFAIHHLEDVRKQTLLAEIHERLRPGGIFANLEHVSSPTPRLHEQFLEAIGYGPDEEDASNRLVDVATQLGWMRTLGFDDVDCVWKWREMALLVGVRT
jgi:tRNA (cmo5U34)-methyltransferase